MQEFDLIVLDVTNIPRKVSGAPLAAHVARSASAAGNMTVSAWVFKKSSATASSLVPLDINLRSPLIGARNALPARTFAALANYLDGDYEGAIDVAQRVIRSYPEFPLIYRWLAATLGQVSRTEEARQILDKAIAIGAGTFDMYVRRRVTWHRPEGHEHMLDGLRKAAWLG